MWTWDVQRASAWKEEWGRLCSRNQQRWGWAWGKGRGGLGRIIFCVIEYSVYICISTFKPRWKIFWPSLWLPLAKEFQSPAKFASFQTGRCGSQINLVCFSPSSKTFQVHASPFRQHLTLSQWSRPPGFQLLQSTVEQRSSGRTTQTTPRRSRRLLPMSPKSRSLPTGDRATTETARSTLMRGWNSFGGILELPASWWLGWWYPEEPGLWNSKLFAGLQNGTLLCSDRKAKKR